MWIIKIVILGSLYFFNAIRSFLPKKLKDRYPVIEIVGFIVAIILVAVFVNTEITKYVNYSYAEISEAGTIIKSKNFKYKIEQIKDRDGSPSYIILGKYDLDNLNITSHNSVVPDISVIVPGVKIKFIGNGFGNPTVKSNFKIEIRKN